MSRGFTVFCTPDDARRKFSEHGLSYSDITDGDILMLAMLLNREIKKSNKYGETSCNTMRLSNKQIVKHNTNGTIKECYLFMNSHYFTQRECISFNKNGLIAFAGWADQGNMNPILRAFCEWCEILKNQGEDNNGTL